MTRYEYQVLLNCLSFYLEHTPDAPLKYHELEVKLRSNLAKTEVDNNLIGEQ